MKGRVRVNCRLYKTLSKRVETSWLRLTRKQSTKSLMLQLRPYLTFTKNIDSLIAFLAILLNVEAKAQIFQTFANFRNLDLIFGIERLFLYSLQTQFLNSKQVNALLMKTLLRKLRNIMSLSAIVDKRIQIVTFIFVPKSYQFFFSKFSIVEIGNWQSVFLNVFLLPVAVLYQPSYFLLVL